MGTPAPKPINFHAMANAWDDPIAFARELNAYYSQLAAVGALQEPHDWTEQKKENHA
ncbi:hypothetical protein [Microbacterium azadirachtae]|uniref:Uncharacterized protein n=1 Tax=Microbacterium azadirachtae TaxID=582680 RepID=A0A0F0LVK2_9MICO|nr:hypothetical protein [Microbacterium azadirachtae]KJL35466.1 hypothetical protein RS86_00462 [Microbacterium azadirachtae]